MSDTVEKKKVRVNLDQKVTKEEYDAISVILKKKVIAERAVQTSAFPKDTEQNVMKAFYQAGLDNYAEAQTQEHRWWRDISEKYTFTEKVYFDVDTGQFYKLEEEVDPATN
jgi:CXXX repeat modification system protein